MKDVIQTTLELVRRTLNDDLCSATATDECVVLSNIADHEGNAYEGARNKVVMLLAGIQQETAIRNLPETRAAASLVPPLHIGLFVLFMANYSGENYPAGLGMISRTINFFHQHPLFTNHDLPGLDPGIDKLTFELQDLNLQDLSSLLQMVGARYLPSVFYKVRVIPFASEGTEPRESIKRPMR